MAAYPDPRAKQEATAMGSNRRRFLIVRNRHAGLKKARLVARVASALQAHGATAEIIETARAEHMHGVLANARGIDAVVAAGGDGTVRALALTLDSMRLDLPIGLIPTGTGNVLANEIGLARTAEDLSEVLVCGPARAAHVMQANGTPFLLMASSGFDAAVLLRLSVLLKQKIARAAYALPTIGALTSERMSPFEVVVDGMARSATWVIVANARTYGGNFRLVRDASVFNDDLRAVLFSGRTRAARLKELLWLASGRTEKCAGVQVIACRQIDIRAPRQQPSQIDGDPLGFGPVNVSTTGHTVRLIVPQHAR
jgi:diacylglycerol kinase (ATP)